MLVTIDIGANDLSRCINRATGVIDMTCVAAAFQQARLSIQLVTQYNDLLEEDATKMVGNSSGEVETW